jgi:tripartite-type tricarboxylate transporter receptor subunit TctC
MAQEVWPARPVRVVVPFLAGGGGDAVGRAISQALSERTGRAFVVDNRPGGASALGTELVARAALGSDQLNNLVSDDLQALNATQLAALTTAQRKLATGANRGTGEGRSDFGQKSVRSRAPAQA